MVLSMLTGFGEGRVRLEANLHAATSKYRDWATPSEDFAATDNFTDETHRINVDNPSQINIRVDNKLDMINCGRGAK